MSIRHTVLIGLGGAVLASVLAMAQGIARGIAAGVTTIPLSNVKWVVQSNGLSTAVLMGDPNMPGPYLQLVKWPPNTKLLAHRHPDARYGMVVSGTHYIGHGDRFDERELNANPVGTYFTEPANAPHFGMTKSEGAVLYFYGVGPSGSTQIE